MYSEEDLYNMTPEQIEIELLKREENKKADTLNDFIVSSWAYKLGRIVYDETQKRDIYQGGYEKGPCDNGEFRDLFRNIVLFTAQANGHRKQKDCQYPACSYHRGGQNPIRYVHF